VAYDDRDHLLACAGPLIQKKARQLARRRPFAGEEPEDLAQDLMLEVLRRAPRFDPRKTSGERFVRLVVRNAAADLLRRRRAGKRVVRPLSLSRWVGTADGGSEAAGLVSEADHQARLGTRPRSAAEHAQLAADVAAVLANLPPAQQELARRLLSQSRAEAARELGVTWSALNAQVRRLREVFTDAGLDQYLRGRP
jgi:RNA polymerase sigma-70 factor (ECF subfamily)